MRESIADQIRRQLTDAYAVAVDGIRYLKAGLDHALGRGCSQFIDYLVEDRLQWLGGVAVQRDATAQPAARKIQHVVDQVRHAGDGGIDHVEDAELLMLLQRTRPLK